MDLNRCCKTGSKKCGLALFFFTLVGAAPLLWGCQRPDPGAGGPVLRQDVAQALADAEASQQSVLLFFHAPWCSACGALTKTLADPKVLKTLRRAQTMVVQVEVGTDLAARVPLPPALMPQALGVSGLPTLVYLSGPPWAPSGARLSGYVGPQRLIEWLKSAR